MSGQIQTLATPPPVSVQTLLYNIYLAAGGSGGGGGGGSTAWTDITDKPSSFTPSAHASLHGSAGSDPLTLAQSQVSNLTTDLAAKASTSALTSHTSNISNPHSVTKAQVGLDNCDNTSDADKPISTATQTALDGKASTSHTHSDATTSAAGFMSAADKLKLDGVEAAADVTDAGNVGSAIHGATGKTTPVDADTLPLIDSAASNVLKKLTWANLKATLKTYCDGLYASLSGSYANPSWLASLAWSKITGRPTTLEGYGITNAGTASTSGEYTGAGGAAGGITANGGDGWAEESLTSSYAGGSAGSLNLSGGAASDSAAGSNGGSINTYGGEEGGGGDITTANGGGDIDTKAGIIELGPAGTRTTITAGNSGDVTINLPSADGSNGQFLKTDGSGNWTWASPSGSGDVVGPGSSTANRIAVFADTSGTLLAEKTLAQVLTEFGFTGFPVEIALACSDETTALTTGTAKVTVRVPYAFTVTGVFASVTTAPVGSTLIVDINEAGTSILSTKLSIDAGEKSSDTAASAAVTSDTSIAAYAEITIDIDQIGSSTAGAGLKVWILGVRA